MLEIGFMLKTIEAVDLIYNKSIKGETYNVASKNEVTNLELINIINQAE